MGRDGKGGKKNGVRIFVGRLGRGERFVKAARGNAFLDLPSVELINEVSCAPSGDGT